MPERERRRVTTNLPEAAAYRTLLTSVLIEQLPKLSALENVASWGGSVVYWLDQTARSPEWQAKTLLIGKSSLTVS